MFYHKSVSPQLLQYLNSDCLEFLKLKIADNSNLFVYSKTYLGFYFSWSYNKHFNNYFYIGIKKEKPWWERYLELMIPSQ